MAGIMAIIPGLLIAFWLKKKKLITKSDSSRRRLMFLLGALSTIFAVIAEDLCEEILLDMYNETSVIYMFLDNFLVAAFIEELVKFVALLFCLKHISPDDEASGCISGIFVGLGFGIVENLMYSLDGDICVMLLRAVYCVPGHALYGMYMGYFLWRGINEKRVLKNVFLAFFIPLIQHGLYDFCIGCDQDLLILWTMVYNLILYRYAFSQLKRISKNNDSYFQTSFDVLRASIP